MLISKRDLLDETGISYGQLYRWKREGLIPEEWFIKQSAYTGQETFFPKDLILSRIKAIQGLKDKYTLEEVAKLLSPEVPSKGFDFEDLEGINEISNEILRALKGDIDEDGVMYIHVLLLIIITTLKEELSLYISQVVEIYKGIRTYIKSVKSTNYIYKIYEVDKKYFSILYQEESNFFMDYRFVPIKSFRIEDVSNEFKIKHKTQFDYFMTDAEDDKKVGLNEKDRMDDVELEISNIKDKYDQSFFESYNQVEKQGEKQVEKQKEKQEEKKLDESDTIKISLDDIEIISSKSGSKINGSKNSDNGSYQYNNQSGNENKQGNKKSREDDKIVIKFNNWEVRL